MILMTTKLKECQRSRDNQDLLEIMTKRKDTILKREVRTKANTEEVIGVAEVNLEVIQEADTMKGLVIQEADTMKDLVIQEEDTEVEEVLCSIDPRQPM